MAEVLVRMVVRVTCRRCGAWTVCSRDMARDQMRFHDRTKLDIFGNRISESCVAQSSELDLDPELEIVPQLPVDFYSWEASLAERLRRANDALEAEERAWTSPPSTG